ncbi:hypothetical protein QAD02_006793 [Eretmocerus hayati]|uniref:Uncharacterized protein n=1 Tax=Eretmocerus hayati TaxID=131215 RepID=A0ACC2N2N3_9HYME|nr:hypothetical protein QAD02_006793 [Eretmocerus hayati]
MSDSFLYDLIAAGHKRLKYKTPKQITHECEHLGPKGFESITSEECDQLCRNLLNDMPGEISITSQGGVCLDNDCYCDWYQSFDFLQEEIKFSKTIEEVEETKRKLETKEKKRLDKKMKKGEYIRLQAEEGSCSRQSNQLEGVGGASCTKCLPRGREASE